MYRIKGNFLCFLLFTFTKCKTENETKYSKLLGTIKNKKRLKDNSIKLKKNKRKTEGIMADRVDRNLGISVLCQK